MNVRLAVCVLITTCTITSAASASSVTYQMKKLGLLAGVTSAKPLSINNNGEAVGYAFYGDRYFRACYWNANGKMSDLGLGTSNLQSVARKINDSGQIIGDDDWGNNAVLWNSPNSSPISLASAMHSLVDINNAGQIVGSASYATSMAVRNPDGTVHKLKIPQFWGISAINDSGIMAGYQGAPYESYIYNIDDTLLPISGMDSVYDINNRNQVIGVVSINGKMKTGIWSPSGSISTGSITWLQPISGAIGSVGFSINNCGTAVGYCWGFGSYACLWTPQGEVVNLGALAGQVSSEAYAINDNGWVVGSLYSGGSDTPVVWVPVPEPSSLLAILGGCGTLAFFRRRK